MKKILPLLVLVFLVGAGIRAINVWRPVDRPVWRETDEAGIARNYVREGMNIFFPRVDWRGDTPGYAEMEFPAYPWLIAVSYKVFGQQEFLGRIISWIFSLLTLLVFFRLAADLLPSSGAVFASIFFALSPLAINVSTSLQPESLMFFLYLLSALLFVRFHRDQGDSYLWLSALAVGGAILAKLPAAHIGLFFGLLLLEKYGLAAVGKLRVWAFGLIALLPGVAWYVHARSFWTKYQLSLGLSNEHHWVGTDILTNPHILLGIIRSEVLYVFTPLGVMVALAALYLGRREKALKYGLFWMVAIAAYYILAARTTSAQWAAYYHIVSIPPAALLFGIGVNGIYKLNRDPLWTRALTLISLSLTGAAGCAVWMYFSGVNEMNGFVLPVILLASGALGYIAISRATSPGSFRDSLAAMVGFACIFGTMGFQFRQIAVDLDQWKDSELRSCARSFAPMIPENALILVTGGTCVNETGKPAAYNASFMHYWTDRRGFNICIEEQSIEGVEAYKRRGAEYYLVARSSLSRHPGLEQEMISKYPVMAQCGDYYLLRLGQPFLAKDSRPQTPSS